MAVTTTIENCSVEPTTGNTVIRLKNVLSGAVTGATITDYSWKKVDEVKFHTSSASATNDVYFDGTNVVIAGFPNNATVYVTIIGIPA